MHRIHEIYEKLEEIAACEVDRDARHIDYENLGGVIDMLKDIKQMEKYVAETAYFEEVTEAMEHGETHTTKESYQARSPEWFEHKYGTDVQKERESEKKRKIYMEMKEYQTEDKQAKMKALEHYAVALSDDIAELISGASAEEKAVLKSKMSALMQKI